MWHIKKKDKVVVLAGKDKGKQGEVVDVNHKKGLVLVSKVNMVKRHAKATQTDAASIREQEAWMPKSKLMLICPKTQKPTRVRFDRLADGTKARVSLASGEMVG
jgi:large subunit ribosomal protein L24